MDNKSYRIKVLSDRDVLVHFYNSLESTNIEAQKLARSGASDWTVVVANVQTGGQGRYNRKWHSPAGKGLWISIILQSQIELDQINLLNLETAIIIRNFLEQVTRDSIDNSKDRFFLKWPNDVMVNNKKVCGILIKSEIYRNLSKNLIVGIGININQKIEDFESDIRQSAISVSILTGIQYHLKDLLDKFIKYYYQSIHTAVSKNFKNTISEYKKYMIYLGSDVEIRLQHESVFGKIINIDDFGCLMVDTKKGIKKITVGDIWGTVNE